MEGLRQMKAAFKLKKGNKGYKSRHISTSSQPLCFEHARWTQAENQDQRTVGKRWTWDFWLSRSINGQSPSRSCRSSVSTRMLLLQRSKSQLSLDLESHRSGAFVAQIGAPTIWYKDSDPWTQKLTSEWTSPSMLRCYMLWRLWLTKLQGTEVVVWLACI